MSVDIQNVPFVQLDGFRTSYNADTAAAVESEISKIKSKCNQLHTFLSAASVVPFHKILIENNIDAFFRIPVLCHV